MKKESWIVAMALLVAAAAPTMAGGPITVKGDGPPDETGRQNAVLVESAFYRIVFNLRESGAAGSMVFKPLDHELRAENYYANHANMLRDWVRLQEPDPSTGFTPDVNELGTYVQSRLPAEYRVLKQTADELAIEFEVRNSTRGGQEWMDKLLTRRRVFLRNDTPAVRVECEVLNTDTEDHSVIFDFYNGLNLGRVTTLVSIPGLNGKLSAVDAATEGGSSLLSAQNVAEGWIGGVNENGLGGAFAFDWPDVDAMQAVIHKTVGTSYHVAARRRTVEAGKSIVFKYTFMPFTDFGALDGMRDDLVGGMLIGDGRNELEVRRTRSELKAGDPVPVTLYLASGRDRQISVGLQCVRREDGKTVLEERRTVELKVDAGRGAETKTIATRLTLPDDGLYVLTATADGGDGTVLRMEKPIQVGKTRLTFEATAPAGAKRGQRDAGENMGAPSADPIFRTVDPSFVTPHLPLLKNHVRGPIRAFFVTPADTTLGHARETAQRADMTYDYCALTRGAGGTLSQQNVSEFQKKLRAHPPEVLISLGLDWGSAFPKDLLREILNDVRDGMGALIALPVAANRANWEAQILAYGQRDLAAAFAEGKEIEDDSIRPLLATMFGLEVHCFEIGKGRIVVIVCPGAGGRDSGEMVLGDWKALACGKQRIGVEEFKWRGFEYGYAHLADMARWAAGKESDVRVTSAALGTNAIAVRLVNVGETVSGTLHVTERSRRWEARTSVEMPVVIPSGESVYEVPLSGEPEGGAIAFEIQARDATGRVLAFGSGGVAVPQPVKATVEAQPAFQSREKPGKCVVTIEGALPAGELEVRVTDRFGRLVLRSRQPLTNSVAKRQIEIGLESVRALDVYHEIVADVYAPDESGVPRLVTEAVNDLYLLPAKPPYDERFTVGVANAPERTALSIQGILPSARDAGFTLYDHKYDNRALYAYGGMATCDVHVRPTKDRYAVGDEKIGLNSEKLIMTPPLLPGEAAVETRKRQWQSYVRREYDTGVRHVFIDDERRMSADFDFNPDTLKGMREWLRARYSTISALNGVWGTSFSDFAEVMPKTRAEATNNLAPWLEFRMYIGDVIGEYYMKKQAEWAAEIAPDLSVSEKGIYAPDASWPVDWAKYARYYRRMSQYGGLEDIIRAFAPDTFQGNWMGYGWRYLETPRQRVGPWASLLNGGHWMWIWSLYDIQQGYAVVTSDQRLAPVYADLARDEFSDLTGGIDRLILSSRFADDGIAVAYSYPSWLLNAQALASNSRTIMAELGYQYNFVNLDGIEKAGIGNARWKLLVMEQAACLSVAQSDVIREFVQRGGTLLCVGRNGDLDQHGVSRAAGALADEWTGVDASERVTIGLREAVEENADDISTVTLQYGGIAIKDAEILLKANVRGEAQPVLTCRRLGQGRVFWLNVALDDHQKARSGGFNGEAVAIVRGKEDLVRSHWNLFRMVLKTAGLEPRCQLLDRGQPVFGAPTWYYESPSGRSLFIAHAAMKETGGPLTVRFARKGHVYEMRSGRYYGLTDTIEETFPPGRMMTFAILDHKVEGADVAMSASKAKPGDALRLMCAVRADSGPPDLHAFRVRVTDPDGKALPAYATVVPAPNGEAEIDLPLALDQKPGTYRVQVTDALSGAKAETRFEVGE